VTEGLRQSLARDRLSLALLVGNFVTAVGAWRLATVHGFSDAKGYLMMGDGLRHGVFSSWYFLPEAPPETLRMPGYPLFLALVRSIAESDKLVQVIQLGTYFAALGLSLSTLHHLSSGSALARRIFLVCTACSIQVPFFSGYISSDSLTIFTVALYVWLFIVRPWNLTTGVLMGITIAAGCYFRPAVLLLAPAVALGAWVIERRSPWPGLVHLAVFGVLLVPFGLWNLKNHGVFKVTPVEGGGGASHLGYWSFRLPPGYADRFYWGNPFIEDLFNPFKVSADEGKSAIAAYEEEWTGLAKRLEPAETEADHQLQAVMKGPANPGIIPIRASKYAQQREKLMWEKVREHAASEPWFYLRTRAYTLVRNYFTGINAAEWRAAPTLLSKLKLLGPPAVQLTFIFCGLVISLALLVVLRAPKGFTFLVLLALYFGVVHIPFLVGARYTVPAHLCILMSLAGLSSRWWTERRSRHASTAA
jgi:hypothetical protein